MDEQEILKHKEWYLTERPRYELLAEKVRNIFEDILREENIGYQDLTHRAKDVESFTKKLESGFRHNPQKMQDLAGIRIVVSVNSDIEKIEKIIESNFSINESVDKSTGLGTDKVGYRSIHFIASLPSARLQLPEYRKFEGLHFEIQLRTILQHAWAQIGHDKTYKVSGSLPPKIKRQFTLLSGLLEIADNEFERITQEIIEYSKDVVEKTRGGDFDIPINSISLRGYLVNKFKKIPQVKPIFGPDDNLIEDLLEEMRKMGLKTLDDFEKIIPPDFIKELHNHLVIKKDIIDRNLLGVTRDILVIHDSKKYFENAWNNTWGGKMRDEKLLQKFGVDINYINSHLIPKK